MSRRGSKESRICHSRYFYVMGEGWYVLTREGESGPYPNKEEAEEFVDVVLTGISYSDLPTLEFY
jgi:hypothetical protein